MIGEDAIPNVEQPWVARTDSYGRTFFFNTDTQQTSWEIPGVHEANNAQKYSRQVDAVIASGCEAIFLVFDVTNKHDYESISKGKFLECLAETFFFL